MNIESISHVPSKNMKPKSKCVSLTEFSTIREQRPPENKEKVIETNEYRIDFASSFEKHKTKEQVCIGN